MAIANRHGIVLTAGTLLLSFQLSVAAAHDPMAADLQKQIDELQRQVKELQTSAAQPTPTPPESVLAPAPAPERPEQWGVADPGRGFRLANTKYGDLSISEYALARYIYQAPGEQHFVDHLGRRQSVDSRQDFSLHRVMIHVLGWMFDPNFRYQLTTWTVNSLETVRVIGALSYRFADELTIGAGVGALPGTRTLQGSHPLWLGHDRVMADEYFRPGFTQGIWANGEILPRFHYKLMIANNLTALGVNAGELTRDLAYGGSVFWMPTTGEFGPQGALGDFERHDRVATRFGAGYTISPREDRASQPSQSSPDNTQIRIGDSLLLFGGDSLANGVTIQKARFQLVAADAGVKYKGFFSQVEGYYRKLDNFSADGPAPRESLEDFGFYLQNSFVVLPELIEAYASTSFIFTDPYTKMNGDNLAYEYLFGLNWYPFRTRYQRINVQFIDVTRSPTHSLFGYYLGGLTGQIFTVGASVAF